MERIQNRAIKNLYGLQRLTPSVDIHRDHGLLTLKLQYFTLAATRIHHIKNNFSHTTMSLIYNSCFHEYPTRSNNLIRKTKSRSTKYGVNSIFNKAVEIYNTLPTDCHSLNKQHFKTYLKNLCFHKLKYDESSLLFF